MRTFRRRFAVVACRAVIRCGLTLGPRYRRVIEINVHEQGEWGEVIGIDRGKQRRFLARVSM